MIEVVSNDEWLSSQVSEESVSCIFGSCEAILAVNSALLANLDAALIVNARACVTEQVLAAVRDGW